MTEQDTDPAFESLLDYLKRARGFDFTGYKRSSLTRRVRQRMQTVRINDFTDYVDYLQVHPEEFTQLFNTILINVTAFFRDQEAWDYLAHDIVPRILATAEPIRIWSAGCASGEEPYTLAMLFAEAMGTKAFLQRVKIYATDVDEEALAQARQASYTAKDLEPVPPALRATYFVPSGGHSVFRTDLRRAVIFGRHDLVQDAPISRLDLLVCRNTLMYFNAETQGRILARFHFALNESGYLFLGRAELLLTHANLFTLAGVKHRIFTRTARVDVRDRPLVTSQAHEEDAASDAGRATRLRDAALESGFAAQLIIDSSGKLVVANARAREVFSVHQQDIGRPFHDLEVSYRPADLRSLIDRAYADGRAARLAKVERLQPQNTVQHFDIHATPLRDNGDAALGVLVTFDDVSMAEQLQVQVQRANQVLETTNEELQSAHEELETTNEELQSTNEELATTNEELQSTNEELETMNEELQSTNEELQTINDELRDRSGEANTSNAFLRAILASIHIGVAVVDADLVARVWNHRAEDLWGLRQDEVIGKSLAGLDIGLPIERIPLRAFLSGTADIESLDLEATTRRGKAVRCHVTFTPYIGPGGDRDGVVILMEVIGEQ